MCVFVSGHAIYSFSTEVYGYREKWPKISKLFVFILFLFKYVNSVLDVMWFEDLSKCNWK